MTRIWIVVTSSLLLYACSSAPAPPPDFPGGELIDLTHAYDEQTVFWPTADRFHLEKVSDGVTPAGYYYAANKFSTAEHGGTHIDAPVHFASGRQSVDQIPLESLVGAIVVIDVSDQATKDADYQVTADDIQKWEQAHGQIPRNAIVLLRTGFSSRWPDAAQYLGTAERGEAAVAKLHFPGLHPDAARWLIANRSIKAVGVDTASIDYGKSKLFETHRALFDGNVPAFENLASLDRLPPTGAYIMALPMKIKGGSGGPLRAVAVVPK
jgi:kynurenine formamidase